MIITGPTFLEKLKVSRMIAVAVLMTTTPILAQVFTGTILGTVRDSSGGVIAGATVTVTQEDTGLKRSFTTGGDGSYRFASLPVGNYDLSADRQGFKTASQIGLVLAVGQEAVINFTMAVGSPTQSVTVTAEPPLVNTTNPSLGGLVDQQKVADLPLNGRSYIDLTLLQPGITQQTNMGTAANEAMGAGLIFSSNGAPTRSNNPTIDGTTQRNFFGLNAASSAHTTLGLDGVKEYQVTTRSYLINTFKPLWA